VPLDLTPLLSVHDAVRRDLVRLSQVLGGTAPLPPDRAGALRAHWHLVVGVLAAHERAENDELWPALRAAVPAADHAVVDAALAQNAAIEAVLDDAQRLVDDASSVAGRGPRDELAAAVERVAVLVDHHFALEEDRLVPLVERFLPEDDWTAFVEAWRADPGPGGGATVLPFLLEHAHPARTRAVLADLPDEDRAAYAGEWRPAHQTRAAILW
jgi:hypothetical protein